MKNISKIVIIKDGGKRFGYVLNVVLSENFDVSGWLVVEEESENIFFVSAGDIKFLGEFAFVESADKLTFSLEDETLLGKRVINSNGVDFGFVQDLEILRRRCVKIVTDRCEIKPKMVGFIGKDFIFLGKKKSGAKKFERPKVDVEVKIMTAQPRLEKPVSISLSPNFYIGQIALQDIFGYNNERLVVKGEKISKNTFERVKKHNRLNDLFFAIKSK